MTSLSPESRAIIDDASSCDGLDEERKIRMRGRLMAQIAAGAAVGTAVVATAGSATAASAAKTGAAKAASAAAGQSLLALGVTSAIKAGLVTVVVLATATAGYRWFKPTPPAGQTPIAAVAPSAIESPEAPPSASPAPRAKGSEEAHEPEDRGAPPTRPAASSIAAETELLRRAHMAIAAGDDATALALLEQHRREHPQGALLEEREAARILALCGAGRGSEARAAAARFAATFPRSPHRARVLSACAEKK